MIPIQNVYYMLAYAFKVLNDQGYKKIATEEFHNAEELCAAILIQGLSIQIKRGLGKEYIPKTDSLTAIRGQVDISQSIKTRAMLKKRMICNFDEFSENSYMNQVIKTTMVILLRTDISKTRKKELRNLFVYFGNVDGLDADQINWNFNYDRNNQTYKMLIAICYLIVQGHMQSSQSGSTTLMDFIDQQHLPHLFEKFVLEYCRKEHPYISASASQIPWFLDDGQGEMLPIMQSDIMLTGGNKTLIIDAKYYSKIISNRFNSNTLHSANLYQIFTYVKNKARHFPPVSHVVSGMLLYAKTDEEIAPNNTYWMSGSKIMVRTLDLNCDFEIIRTQLDTIVSEHFSSYD